MRALFITTQTVDCINHVQAWNSFAPVPAIHLTFDHYAIPNDWLLVEGARRTSPDVIFYIGPCKSRGTPKPNTFLELQGSGRSSSSQSIPRTAIRIPLIHLCSDATDHPWHSVLEIYRKLRCFDLQVAIDGGHRDAPVDMATLTPIDPRPFVENYKRDIRCGFSGSVGHHSFRSEVINALKWLGGLTVRYRVEKHDYQDHVHFMKRCRMMLNISYTGSSLAHHIKGRVLEAGFAGCCLLESEGSPIGEWFPDDCYVIWKDVKHAAELISDLDDLTIERTARRLSEEVCRNYTAVKIYGEILERIGLHVGSTEPRTTT